MDDLYYDSLDDFLESDRLGRLIVDYIRRHPRSDESQICEGVEQQLSVDFKLSTSRFHNKLQTARQLGLAIICRNGRYWLSESASDQVVYALWNTGYMYTRSKTTYGALYIQDRHDDSPAVQELRAEAKVRLDSVRRDYERVVEIAERIRELENGQ